MVSSQLPRLVDINIDTHTVQSVLCSNTVEEVLYDVRPVSVSCALNETHAHHKRHLCALTIDNVNAVTIQNTTIDLSSCPNVIGQWNELRDALGLIAKD